MLTTWNIHQDENLKKKKNYEYGNVSNTQNTACSFYITENLVSSLSTVINTFVVMKQQSLTLMCNNLNIITMYYQNLTSNLSFNSLKYHFR